MRRLKSWIRQLTPPRIEPIDPPERGRGRPAPAQRKRSYNEAAHKRGR
jgi:hypothetical protein